MKRSCGDCKECCTTMRVDSLKKPAHVACGKLCSTGCSVYEDRPEDCSDWSCGWLQDDGTLFRRGERPDLIGVIVDIGKVCVAVHSCSPGKPRSFEASALIERFAQRGPVALVDGTTRKMTGRGAAELVSAAQLTRGK